MKVMNVSTESNAATHGGAGELLRQLRSKRGFSQLELSLQAGVSSRHLSYIETGKSQPSRQMIVRLCDVLSISLRERNALLTAAGYAPYRETPMTMPGMKPLRQAIELTLAHHEPLPAFVVNRHWDVLNANQGMQHLLKWLTSSGEHAHPNILLQVFDPASVRPHIHNWEELSRDLLQHLQSERMATPFDDRLRELYERVLAFPGVPHTLIEEESDADALPVMMVVFRKAGRELRFFSTITKFATPRDVTAEDVRIECMFAMDAATRAFCDELRAHR